MKARLKILLLASLCGFCFLLGSLSGCEISGEIPELNYFLNREWKLEKVTVNGLEDTDVDLSPYRLQLNEDFTFNETSIKGNELEGTWRLDNNATILTLEYAD